MTEQIEHIISYVELVKVPDDLAHEHGCEKRFTLQPRISYFDITRPRTGIHASQCGIERTL